MSAKIGLDCKLFQNTGSYGAPTWTEVDLVHDLNVTIEYTEGEATTRGNGGWAAFMACLKQATVEFDMPWDTEDARWDSLRDAAMKRTALEFFVADGPAATVGTQGIRASFQLFRFNRDEPIEGAAVAQVSMRPTYSANAPAFLEISA